MYVWVRLVENVRALSIFIMSTYFTLKYEVIRGKKEMVYNRRKGREEVQLCPSSQPM